MLRKALVVFDYKAIIIVDNFPSSKCQRELGGNNFILHFRKRKKKKNK